MSLPLFLRTQTPAVVVDVSSYMPVAQQPAAYLSKRPVIAY